MNRVAEKFSELSKQGRKALIPFIMAGDQSVEETERLILLLEKSGADLIELGVPFSDPLADGPVIQEAAQRALSNGFKTSDIFPLIQKVRKQVKVPILLLMYYNLIYQTGLEEFLKEASRVGIDGLVIPDLPPEEASEVKKLSIQYNVALNFLIAPTSTPERIKTIAAVTTGFIYLVSVKGVTGERRELPIELPTMIKTIKSITSLPIAVGFGISDPDQAASVGEIADGVIVGSSVVKRMAEGTTADKEKKVARYVRELKEAILR